MGNQSRGLIIFRNVEVKLNNILNPHRVSGKDRAIEHRKYTGKESYSSFWVRTRISANFCGSGFTFSFRTKEIVKPDQSLLTGVTLNIQDQYVTPIKRDWSGFYYFLCPKRKSDTGSAQIGRKSSANSKRTVIVKLLVLFQTILISRYNQWLSLLPIVVIQTFNSIKFLIPRLIESIKLMPWVSITTFWQDHIPIFAFIPSKFDTIKENSKS